MARVLQVRCPNCKKSVPEGAKFFPFCSERCRMVDLGGWLTERYRVERPIQEQDLDDESGEMPLEER